LIEMGTLLQSRLSDVPIRLLRRPDDESGIFNVWLRAIINMGDARCRRPLVRQGDETPDMLCLTRNDRFHRTVRAVANPA
jgi:hypothetical protein